MITLPHNNELVNHQLPAAKHFQTPQFPSQPNQENQLQQMQQQMIQQHMFHQQQMQQQQIQHQMQQQQMQFQMRMEQRDSHQSPSNSNYNIRFSQGNNQVRLKKTILIVDEYD